MLLFKRLHTEIDGTGPCIGIIMADGKGRVAYSMARKSGQMATQEGRCALCKNEQIKRADKYDEIYGIGVATKRLLSRKNIVEEFAKANAQFIVPANVEAIRKCLTSEDKNLPEEVKESLSVADRIYAELLDMEERSQRYYREVIPNKTSRSK